MDFVIFMIINGMLQYLSLHIVHPDDTSVLDNLLCIWKKLVCHKAHSLQGLYYFNYL